MSEVLPRAKSWDPGPSLRLDTTPKPLVGLQEWL